MAKCPCCGKEKENVGPKIVGKVKSEDPRLSMSNDTLVTKVMCQECCDILNARKN